MKKSNLSIVFLFFISFFISFDSFGYSNTTKEKMKEEFKQFMDELDEDKDQYYKETMIIMGEMHQVLDETKLLINESKKEIQQMSYIENRNILIASIFLWVSITIFIIMNLVFANNLKKEIYFLRNTFLKIEIKDNMIVLSNQINNLCDKLDELNNKKDE